MLKETGAKIAGWPIYLTCAALAAALLIYSQTLAFAWDEGFHLLTSQLIARGKTPYLDFIFPQPPLNAYWVVLWMRVFGDTWRTAQALSALETAVAIALVADFLLRHFPAPGWRAAAAFTGVFAFGLNSMVVEFGAEGQAYGFCLLLSVLAFRCAVRALAEPGWPFTLAAGFFAGAAAAATLLTAPIAPVMLLWLLVFHTSGNRLLKFVVFSVGAAIPWTPVIVLFIKAPAVVWFGLAGYNILYRRNGWGDPTEHDIGVLISWIDSAQALSLALLALAGLAYIVKSAGWLRRTQAPFYLCAWLAAAECLHLSFGRPTFERYFLFVVPFLSILAAAGLHAIAARFGGRARWTVGIAALIMSLGLAKALYEERDALVWGNLEEMARKVDEVTPRNGTLLADEHIYFLTRRPPPSGMELDYSHRLLIPADFAAQLHVVLRSDLNRRILTGVYDTIATCELEKAAAIGIPALYSKTADIADCRVYWGFKRVTPTR